jgi:hypothetical protein
MGSGYRVFTAGEVLSASNVQNYLQDQAVMVFGGTAARSSAIGTANFEEGMLTYLTDVDKLQVYTGAAFADVYPPAASSQGLTLISTTSFSAVSSVSLPANTFTSTYDNYRVIFSDFTGTNQDYAIMRLRASGSDNSTTNYFYRLDERSSTGPGGGSPDETATGNSATSWARALYVIPAGKCSFSFELYNPKASVRTQMTALGVRDLNGVTYTFLQGLSFNATTSFDSLSVIANTGTITGKYSVFGYAK